jgi:regulatory protein
VSEESFESAHRRALGIVWRALSRRDRTVAELRAALERRGIESEAAEAALADVAADGYLDDAVFARRFAENRTRIDGWGHRRIEGELRRRGVPDEIVDATLAPLGPEAELEGARALLAERIGALEDDRDRRRALGLLARRGYAAEIAYDAIRLHEASAAARY